VIAGRIDICWFFRLHAFGAAAMLPARHGVVRISMTRSFEEDDGPVSILAPRQDAECKRIFSDTRHVTKSATEGLLSALFGDR